MESVIDRISEEERGWLRLLAEGKQISEVAAIAGKKKGTFVYKINIVKEKLGCKNMASLIYFATKNGLIE